MGIIQAVSKVLACCPWGNQVAVAFAMTSELSKTFDPAAIEAKW